MYLSVIIPAYNEEKRLPETLRQIDRYMRKQSYDYEILVVNDGSKDKTAKITRELVSEIKNLRLIDNKENHGKGYAVKQGMLKAKGKYRLFTDADESTSIEQVENIFPEFEKGRDIVIGSRDVKGAILDPPQARHRRLLGDIFNLIVQAFSGLWGVWDTQCGFKGFSEKAVKDIFPYLTIERWAFDVEILVLAKKQGYKIKEIPVLWKNDPESKVKLKGMFRMLKEIIQIKLNSIKGVYAKKN